MNYLWAANKRIYALIMELGIEMLATEEELELFKEPE